MMRFRYLGFFLVWLLASCSQSIELHTNLSETDANEVIAELASKRIEAEKVASKDGVSVVLDVGDMAKAVRVLGAVGLPHKSRSSLGDVFQKDGVISSPLEERARYIYALSQELEATLSRIDGVIVARVHVVLPERIAPGEPVQSASAAVFIKHSVGLDPDVILSRVQHLVRSSIPGLAEDENKLAVVFVPAQAYQDELRLVGLGPFLVAQEEKEYWMKVALFAVFGVILFLILVIGGVFLWLKPELRSKVGLGKSRGKADKLGDNEGGNAPSNAPK